MIRILIGPLVLALECAVTTNTYTSPDFVQVFLLGGCFNLHNKFSQYNSSVLLRWFAEDRWPDVASELRGRFSAFIEHGDLHDV